LSDNGHLIDTDLDAEDHKTADTDIDLDAQDHNTADTEVDIDVNIDKLITDFGSGQIRDLF
jgi:hypothetical protein